MNPLLHAAVEIEGGWIQGVPDENGVGAVFRGIPYAAPPTGALRWCPPRPVLAWSGVRLCDRYGHASLQPMIAASSLMSVFGFEDPPECGISEDCLYLNVWSCAESPQERRPVIVWVHGGGNRVGAGSHPCARGHNLARRGAVVVTLNYRLGPAGFLAHPELTQEQGASGNYAGQDIVQALKWVRDHIEKFGGDPGCVTIVGQSAGAGHVQSLMASPMARGLLHRAVGFSGGRFQAEMFGYWQETLAAAETKSKSVLEPLGVKNLKAMRRHPLDQLWGPRNFWNIIVDGKFLESTAYECFAAGRQAPVPLMAGFTSDESTPFPNPSLWTVEALRAHLIKTFGEDFAHRLEALYPFATDSQAKLAAYRLQTEGGFAWQPWRWAILHASRHPTWLTRFEHPHPQPAEMDYLQPPVGRGYGAFHGNEIFYYFDTLASCKVWPWTPEDHAIADFCATALIAFARDGTPNHAALADWPAIKTETDPVMHVSRQPHLSPLEELPRLVLLTEILQPKHPPAKRGALGTQERP